MTDMETIRMLLSDHLGMLLELMQNSSGLAVLVQRTRGESHAVHAPKSETPTQQV